MGLAWSLWKRFEFSSMLSLFYFILGDAWALLGNSKEKRFFLALQV